MIAMQESDDELSRTDVLDRGVGITMRATADAERAVRLLTEPQSIPNPDGKGGRIYQVKQPDGTYPIPECVSCFDEIPLLRMEMGRIRCVHCQEFLEKK